MWGVKKVVMMIEPVAIGALGVVTKNFEKDVEMLEIDARVEIMHYIY